MRHSHSTQNDTKQLLVQESFERARATTGDKFGTKPISAPTVFGRFERGLALLLALMVAAAVVIH